MTTAFLLWRDEWMLGIPAIDADHHQMLVLINRLAARDSDCPVATRLTELVTHLRQHFDNECAFLRSIGYPELAEHCSDHALALAELVDLERQLQLTQASVLSPDDLQSIKRWFFNHVVAEDRHFALYYHQSHAQPDTHFPQ